MNKPIAVATKDCVVNKPVEAKEADIVVAGDHYQGVIFKKFQILETFLKIKLYINYSLKLINYK